MFVITPQVTKVIRRDPFLIVHFNIPKSNRELVNDVFTDEYKILNFGTVKYQRVHPVADISICANNPEDRALYTHFTDEEYNQFTQYPAIFLYMKKDIYEKIDSMSTSEKIQYCSYLNHMTSSIVTMCTTGEYKLYRNLSSEFMHWMNVTPEDIGDLEGWR